MSGGQTETVADCRQSGRMSQISFLGKQSRRFVNQQEKSVRSVCMSVHPLHAFQKKMTSSHFLQRSCCCSLLAAAANRWRFKRIRCLMATVDEEGRLWADFALKYTRRTDVRGCTRSRSRRRRRDGGGVLFDAGRRRSSKLVIFSIVGDVDRSPRGSLTSSGRSGITYYTYRTRLVHFTFAIRFVP